MSFWGFLKSLFSGEKRPEEPPIPQAVETMPAGENTKMTPGEFEDFLRRGGKMDYAINKVENMEERIRAISEHPIQKKVIEHEMMASILDVLKEMNTKLSHLPEINDRVNSLPTLNEVYSLMQKMSPDAPPQIRKDIEQMVGKVESELDEAYLLLIKSKGEMTAEQVSQEFKISRNTASERLNTLCGLGKIKKTRRNRKVFFSLVSENII